MNEFESNELMEFEPTELTQSGMSTGAKVAVGIGATAGLAGAIALTVYLIKRHKAKKNGLVPVQQQEVQQVYIQE